VGASGQLWGRTNGFSDDDTRTPFGGVLAPNTQEYPATCAINDIEVCSATAPPGFPSSTYFRPFLDGKCARFQNVGPMTLSAPQPSCGDGGNANSFSWASNVESAMAKYGPAQEQISLQLLDSGVFVHRHFPRNPPNSQVAETTITFEAIGGAGIEEGACFVCSPGQGI